MSENDDGGKKRRVFRASLPYSTTKFLTLALCRAISILYCFTMTVFHYMLGSVDMTKHALGLYMPLQTSACFCLLLFFHLIGLFKMLFPTNVISLLCRNKASVSPEGIATSSVISRFRPWEFYQAYFGLDGTFGQRGPKYETIHVLRELFETPSYTYQAFQMSKRVSNRLFPNIYGLTIVWDCLFKAVIMNSKFMSQVDRRNWDILLTIVVDTVLGAILPLSVLAPPVLQYLENPTIYVNWVWATNVLSVCKYFLVSGILDLGITIMPLLMSHVLMTDLHQNWTELAAPCKLTRIMPSEEKTKSLPRRGSIADSSRLFKLLFGITNVCWAFGISALALQAASLTSQCDTSVACHLSVQPWFANGEECHCLFIYLNCRYNSELSYSNGTLASLQLHQTLSTDFSTDATMTLMIEECPITGAAPDSINRFTELNLLQLRHTNVTTFNNIDLGKMPKLFTLWLEHNHIKEIPSSLEYNSPIGLYYVGIVRAEISKIPSWIENLSVTSLSLYQNQITEIPDEIYNLKKLMILEVSSNRIESLSPRISDLQLLQRLTIQGNVLNALPNELRALPKLTYMNAAQNALQDIPWSTEEVTLFENFEIFLAQNPICTTGSQFFQNLPVAVCDGGCNPQCDPSWQMNNECEAECDNPECNFDEGDCTERATRYVKNQET